MYNEIPFEKMIAVTNRKLCRRPFLEQVERICSLSVRALILREKDLEEEEYKELAVSVQEICRRHQVQFLPHFFEKTALELGEKQIHLPLWKLRELAGRPELEAFQKIGVSIHAPEEAKEAERLGAAYLTAGHIYTTDCKKGLAPRGIGFLQQVCQATALPVYGIGGIHLDAGQIGEVCRAGAAGVCVMSELMDI